MRRSPIAIDSQIVLDKPDWERLDSSPLTVVSYV
jgi:hypothetical protein